jgi:UDPglucose--hexose-1-phosphate uridylyltransferase
VTPDKHPLLRIEGELARRGAGMFDVMNAVGAHELVSDTPEHERTWADLPVAHMARLLQTYRDRLRDLRRDPRFRHVLVLKNRGAVWSRYQHAHSHVIATPFMPKRIEEELAGAREYYRHKERCAFCDSVVETLRTRQRLVEHRGDFVAFTPFASAHPFETWVCGTAHEADFGAVTDDALTPLAALLVALVARLRAACDDPAYSIALHTGALDAGDRAEFHWHWEIVPHLGHELGMEWGTGIFSNPVSPEEAARRLRDALPG